MKTISTPKSANVRSGRVKEDLTSAPPARPQISAPPALGCDDNASPSGSSAGFQPAVSQASSLQAVVPSQAPRTLERPADWKSAIQQVANLRYDLLTCPGWLKAPRFLAVAALALFLLTIASWFTGCATAPAPSSSSVATAPQAKANDIHSKSGAQLWGERCGFCHNVRSPTSFNDAQWEVATMHMRVRANLTGEERTKILEFLKTAD